MRLKTSCKIISLGNYAFSAKGNLKIHSKFNNVVNFTDICGNLVSIVSKIIGNGPNNIVVDDLSVLEPVNIEITNDHIILNNEVNSLDEIEIYNDKFSIENFALEQFKYNLLHIKKSLMVNAHPLSAAFLIDKKREGNFKRGFELALMKSIRKGMDDLIKSGFINGRPLTGIGMGLTPTGDDLLNGTLLAFSIFAIITNTETLKIRKPLYESIGSTNIISRTFLYYSYLGRFYEKFKELITAMSNGDRLNEAFYKYLDIGETSGADILTGFIIAMEKLLDLED
ncbi:DUF2877 domain-containing protein [bacterium]|nr:DUF2877 domain-containing protein [bacterium]